MLSAAEAKASSLGKEADDRSDLFAFGCLLYEMLVGMRAFEGSSAASVIGNSTDGPLLAQSHQDASNSLSVFRGVHSGLF
jgi:serine/threonine protein kinase